MLFGLLVAAAVAPLSLGPQAQVLTNSWSSPRASSFSHVLEGTPGRRTVTLRARSTAGGGETVSIYPVTASGGRGAQRLLFVVATPQSHTRIGFIDLPPPPAGEIRSRLPVLVVVENAAGRLNSGEYVLTVSP